MLQAPYLKRHIPRNYFDMPLPFPQRMISKTARISTQIEPHLSDRQAVLSSHKVAGNPHSPPPLAHAHIHTPTHYHKCQFDS